MRLKRPEEHNRVALTVIWFLGCIATASAVISGGLIYRAIGYEGIDAAVVALIGQQVSISTLALGALGAMLSSTSPRPAPPPTLADGSPAPTPVIGVPGGEPVTVERAEPEVTTDVVGDGVPPEVEELDDPRAGIPIKSRRR